MKYYVLLKGTLVESGPKWIGTFEHIGIFSSKDKLVHAYKKLISQLELEYQETLSR